MLRATIGLLLGLLVRVWTLTLSARIVWPSSLEKSEARPWVFCFWHGTQLALLCVTRRRGAVAMVSLSRDGAIQRRSLGVQGVRAVRGSSSKGGASGVRSLVRAMNTLSLDALFAADGPRGPYGKAKMGPIVAARLTHARLVPIGSAMASGHVFERAWDRFSLPWPFTRVAVVIGDPIEPDALHVQERLEQAIDDCNRRARDELALALVQPKVTP